MDKFKKWANTDFGILFFLILILPLGLYLAAKSGKITGKRKMMIILVGSIVTAFWLIIGVNLLTVKNDRTELRASLNESKSKIVKLKKENHEVHADYDASNDKVNELEDYREKMKPYESLEKADAKKQEVNNSAAQKVTDKLTALPFESGLTVDNKAALVDARNSYNGLTAEQKKLVDISNLKPLEDKMVQLEADAKKKAEDDAAKKKAEEDAAKQKAAEEAKGYETGITYDQLARDPDSYETKKVKFYGRVVQVMEGDTSNQIRLAVNDDYDTILYGEYPKSLTSQRVLEDDMITISGTSEGLLTYSSTMGGDITIPSVMIEKVQ